MERSKSVDLLRALALFLLCFGRHLTPCPRGSGLYLLPDITMVLARGGWIGVDLFFVLSGFLVSGLLFREHQKFGFISGKQFLIRRGLKIYPSFWVLIIATVAVTLLLQHHFPVKATLSELAFVQNYGPSLWSHTWSLAIEEHFYLFLLVFLLCLSRRARSLHPFRIIPFSFLALAILSLVMRLVTAHGHSYHHKAHLFPSHLRMDSLFFGVFISYFYHYHSEQFLLFAKRFRWPLTACGVLALLPAFIFTLEVSPFIYTFGLTLLYLGSGALLIAGIATTLPDNRGARFVAYIGSHSYSIYLWHLAVALWAIPLFARAAGEHWNWPLYAVTYVTGSLAVGITMALLIEFPTLRIRDRCFPSRARPLSISTIGPNQAMPLTATAPQVERLKCKGESNGTEDARSR